MKKRQSAIRQGEYSDLYCTRCGKKGIPVFRAGRIREAGHLKSMYCMHCGRIQNFVEVRPFGAYNFEEFKMEFEYGNFDNFGNRKNASYKNFISLIHNGEITKKEREWKP